jgi:hypothetical protein
LAALAGLSIRSRHAFAPKEHLSLREGEQPIWRKGVWIGKKSGTTTVV